MSTENTRGQSALGGRRTVGGLLEELQRPVMVLWDLCDVTGTHDWVVLSRSSLVRTNRLAQRGHVGLENRTAL